jgi:hypothetical protein
MYIFKARVCDDVHLWRKENQLLSRGLGWSILKETRIADITAFRWMEQNVMTKGWSKLVETWLLLQPPGGWSNW